MDVLKLTIDDAPAELAIAIREYFPASEWDNAARVSYLESGWNWDAEANTTDVTHPCGSLRAVRDGVRITAEWSIGYFQINWCNYMDWDRCSLWNVRQNVGTAHDLWSRAGWRPWYFSAQQLGLLP